jgi:hypothetical protein
MTRIFYTTDIHGSDACWRKFVNAAAVYEADVLVLGGDALGKAVLLVEEGEDGVWRTRRGGADVTAGSAEERRAMLRAVRDTGAYPYVADPAAAAAFRSSPAERERVLERLARESVAWWLEFADSRLAGTGVRLVLSFGNDDPLWAEAAFAESAVVDIAEDRVVELPGGVEMISVGWVNPTPWDTHRECSEDKLAARVTRLAERLRDPGTAVFNLHAPPRASGLDEAPALDADVRPRDGGATTEPVGSTAVRDALRRYRPALGLHGHIHESRAAAKVGGTTCLNPGSVYGQGTLTGALAVVRRGRLRGYQLVEG